MIEYYLHHRKSMRSGNRRYRILVSNVFTKPHDFLSSIDLRICGLDLLNFAFNLIAND